MSGKAADNKKSLFVTSLTGAIERVIRSAEPEPACIRVYRYGATPGLPFKGR
jgi:hypothetical protein